ncbi:nitrate reductase subunit alpha [Saccharothrix australiensis]|uniref:nitrate reductase (quinone) n=1 Tax=Saccharothrix australiensis TaxID=2072 RepID=A0A495VX40_9PSEU|nr:nitrate reductase subunit alpha [Saccharothrix australiensis]RKT53809.1 respiratory nitrate reductase alpha subunit apoprotein [Saccharothrix australiensis]
MCAARERAGKPFTTDGPATDLLLSASRFLTGANVSDDLRATFREGGRDGDAFYRDRWSHDRVVPSTHGVNCTGSCRWNVFVKDGIITWEAQDVDYPSTGPDRPEYEPRGCPRGASFSWYSYSPLRVRYPYARGVLVEMYREARRALDDPVAAWASIVDDPLKRRVYHSARGRGGLVRVSWDEAVEMVAAAHVHTLARHGPDRIAGFSPIPAMSMVSHAVGSRFMALIGAPMLSFYDWYADLPPASPQVFGDQTDVPESADWWDAAYLVLWGSNVPVTRTPDAHFMTEARYRGQKVVVCSPDYSDATKFADEWLAPHPGTDAALAMAMGHVVLREFFVDRPEPFFTDYARRFTDLPFLVTLDRRDGRFVPGKFLTAADLAAADPTGPATTDGTAADGSGAPGAEWKTVLLDEGTGEPVVPNGSLGFRWADEPGRWNLDLGGVVPALTVHGAPDGQAVEVLLPRFDRPDGSADAVVRGVPARTVAGRTVTTVYDLLLAQYGVGREGLPGRWPTGYDDPDGPATPAWAETVTGVPAARTARIAREFADTAVRSRGRCMIVMGAGTNHWFHSDLVYRSFLTLLLLTGCQGRNGGGWAHYVGQEKVRPLTGWATLAGALDWHRPPRQMIGTAYWYTHTDQWRYDRLTTDALTWPGSAGALAGRTVADCLALSARLGWMPSYPTFDRNPLDLVDEAEAAGVAPAEHVLDQLRSGALGFACDDPDAPANWPRVLTVWRANLLGSSAKGNEYFLRHLLGADHAPRAEEAPAHQRPRSVRWREEAPRGKLDLLLALDFRMTSTTLFADVTLPAATWYEKHDLSSTDMHPFVHSFNAAIDPPWQARTDFDAFHAIAAKLSELAATHLGTRRDLVVTALQHDTPGETAQPGGVVRDWRDGGCEPVPGRTFPALTVVERDYTAIAAKLAALGPLPDKLGVTTKGWTVEVAPELAWLAEANGVAAAGPAAGRPLLDTDRKAADAVLALSGTTNGRVAHEGFRALEERVGRPLRHLAEHHRVHRVTFEDTRSRPAPVVTSPEWSGDESGGRRYAPFTINVEQLKPWHTLTGRQHFFLDHDWVAEIGEQLPVYRPPLDLHRLFGEPRIGPNGPEVTVRYLTPHSKWSIHSEYQDNPLMLTLSRGGPTFWISPADAEAIGVADNDWVEAVNRNGVVVARAIVSHRMPTGTVFMYHAQERTVNVPKSETTGKRGGIHNSLTRLQVKPTHLIGGYGQLSFALNYYGPTGNQRDEVTVLRRRGQEVTY